MPNINHTILTNKHISFFLNKKELRGGGNKIKSSPHLKNKKKKKLIMPQIRCWKIFTKPKHQDREKKNNCMKQELYTRQKHNYWSGFYK